jgi:nitrogen fixation protein
MNKLVDNFAEQYIIPQTDLDSLEEARLALWQLVDNLHITGGEIIDITGAMWRLTHRKYPRYAQLEKEVI